MTSFFVLAGEASGDRLGGALMAGLKSLDPKVTFAGVGGPMMQAQGLSSLFPMDELSVFGIAEVVPKYRHLKRRISQTASAVLHMMPDALITIDSPDFSLRVAARVKTAGTIRTVHYVAPSVWAWRPGRAQKMVGRIDQVLALLPFEPPYMQAVGLRCDFVGHPVAAEPPATAAEIAELRARSGVGDAPVILVLPGSRRGEIDRLAPVFGDALRPVLNRRPDLRVILPAARPVADAVTKAARDWPGNPLVLDPRDLSDTAAESRKRAAFAMAHVALAASGTVSLELAAAAVPMVIAYDMNRFSWQIMSRMLRTDTVTLVNLVDGSRTIPEFLGPACRPRAISDALLRLIADPATRAAQAAAMTNTMSALGRDSEPPGLRAARAVMDGLGL